jgi:hypothetical protein
MARAGFGLQLAGLSGGGGRGRDHGISPCMSARGDVLWLQCGSLELMKNCKGRHTGVLGPPCCDHSSHIDFW